MGVGVDPTVAAAGRCDRPRCPPPLPGGAEDGGDPPVVGGPWLAVVVEAQEALVGHRPVAAGGTDGTTTHGATHLFTPASNRKRQRETVIGNW